MAEKFLYLVAGFDGKPNYVANVYKVPLNNLRSMQLIEPEHKYKIEESDMDSDIRLFSGAEVLGDNNNKICFVVSAMSDKCRGGVSFFDVRTGKFSKLRDDVLCSNKGEPVVMGAGEKIYVLANADGVFHQIPEHPFESFIPFDDGGNKGIFDTGPGLPDYGGRGRVFSSYITGYAVGSNYILISTNNFAARVSNTWTRFFSTRGFHCYMVHHHEWHVVSTDDPQGFYPPLNNKCVVLDSGDIYTFDSLDAVSAYFGFSPTPDYIIKPAIKMIAADVSLPPERFKYSTFFDTKVSCAMAHFGDNRLCLVRFDVSCTYAPMYAAITTVEVIKHERRLKTLSSVVCELGYGYPKEMIMREDLLDMKLLLSFAWEFPGRDKGQALNYSNEDT